jgi:aryl carrier-like protein
MTFQQWEVAIGSKVPTSRNLHDLLPCDLDFFILLSSLGGIFGNVSQSNYAAGNAFQDALAQYRCSKGEKALSINLGWMRTIGAVAENEEYQNFRMDGADMAQIEEEELMSLLDIYCDPVHICDPSKSQILIGTVTPAHLQAHGLNIPDAMKVPLFSSFSTVIGGSNINSTDAEDVATLFKQSESDAQRADLVVQALSKKLARSLSRNPDDLDTGKALFEYGVDSLVAVELRNWIGREFAADVAVFDIMGGATILAVGALVASKSSISRK